MGIEVNPLDQQQSDIDEQEREIRRRVYQASLDDLATAYREHAAAARQLSEEIGPLTEKWSREQRQEYAFEGRIRQLLELAERDGVTLDSPLPPSE